MHVFYVLVLLYVAAFLLIPFGRLIWDAIAALASPVPLPEGLWSRLYRLTRNSLMLASLATALSLAIATPLAVLATKVRLPSQGLFYALLALPLVTPPFMSGFATILLLGRRGILTQGLGALGVPEFSIYGLPGLLITHVMHFVPYAFLLINAGLRSVPRHLEEAATTLGSGFWAVMARIVLPYVQPHVLAGAMLVFLASFGDVGSALLVGGDFRVLPAEIYTSFVSITSDSRVPVIYGAFVILFAMGVLLLVRRLMLRAQIRAQFRTTTASYEEPGLRWVALVVCLGVGMVLFLPYVAIFIASIGTAWHTSLLPAGWTVGHFLRVLRDPAPILTSLRLVAVAIPLTVVISIGVVMMVRDWGRIGTALDYVSQLPFAIPGVVLGFGLAKAYSGVKLAGVEFAAGGAILVTAYTIRRLAYTSRVITAGVERIDPRLEEASLSLGASRLRTFGRVVLPQLRYVLAAAALITLVKVITELSATLMVLPPGWVTMSVFIFQWAYEGFIGPAAAMSMLLLLIVVVGTALASLLQRERA